MPELTPAQFKAVIADKDDLIEQLQSQLKTNARKLEAAEKTAVEATKRHHDGVLDSEFSRIANSMGFPADHIPDAMSWVRKNWTVNDKGEPVLKNATGIDDPTPEEWMGKEKAEGGRWAYIFRGGQSYGGGGVGGIQAMPGEKNPFSDKDWNDTEQARLMTGSDSDKEKAKRLQAAAGFKPGVTMPPDMRKKSPY